MTARFAAAQPGAHRNLKSVIAATVLASLIGASAVAGGMLGGSTAASQPGAAALEGLPDLTLAAATASVALPRTAMAVATVQDWKLAGEEVIAEVGAEVGNAANGSVALRIDAPVLTKAHVAASATAPVAPQTTYAFSARVRALSSAVTAVGATFVIGKQSIALPALNAKWTTVTGVYTSGSDETSVEVALHISRAIRGLGIDDVKLVAPDGSNVVPNPSFESVEAARGIANRSLVMTTKTAAVAVVLPAGNASWEVLRGTKRVASGAVTVKTTITALPLNKVTQGFYTLKVRASDNTSLTATVVVVDSPKPWVAQDRRFGVGLHVENAAVYKDAARSTRALGISEARNDIYWASVETQKNVYTFDAYEGPFARLNAQGVKVLGIVGYGNAVYGSANKYAPTNATGLGAYGRYAAAVAKRFDLVGIEVFNEFNHAPKNKSGKLAAKNYLPLLKAVDVAVNKVKPKLPIVAGATANYNAKWFDDLWKRGGLTYADAVSFHPYSTTGKPEAVAALVKKSRTSMKTYGKTTKPVWITELGTSSRTGGRTTTEQASVLVRSSITAFAAGAKKFYWYDLINDTADKAQQEGNFGLYAHPTKATSAAGIVAASQPKQAAFAQVLTITQLGGRNFRASEKAGTGVVSHAFGPAADTVRVVWAPSGTKTATIRTSSPVVVVAFDGTSRTVKPKAGIVKVKVTNLPVFIRSGKAKAGVTK